MKKFASSLLAIIIALSSLTTVSLKASAATVSFTINGNNYSYYDGQYVGSHIPYSDSECCCAALGVQGHYCCYNNAQGIYKSYWGSNHGDVSENFIYSRPMSECVNNADNMKKYLSASEPGAFVCIGDYTNSANHWHNGHSFIFLGADINGAWIINTNGYGTGYNKVEYRTWDYITKANNSSTYLGYIVCISWPGAASQYDSRIKQSYSPQGVVDTITGTADGKIYIRGWAFDKDNTGVSVPIQVYVGGSPDSGAASYQYEANTLRDDVNTVFGVGSYHGFDISVPVPANLSGDIPVYVYAINAAGGGDNVELKHGTATVTFDDITYKVGFDSNGGDENPADISVISSQSYGDLPVVTRSGYHFDGWFTEKEAGDKITKDSVFSLNENQTLYAHWQEKTVESITLPKTEIQIIKNGTYQIDAAVTPADALNAQLSYSSDDDNIATVSDAGVITAVSSGETTITVSAENDIKSTIRVEVVDSESELFSEWAEELPEGVDAENFNIETKTQYIATTKETAKSTESGLDGWTLDGNHIEYGNWGGTQTTTSPISNSNTVNVTGTSVIYHWYHFCNKYYDGTWGADSIATGSYSVAHYKDTTYMLTPSYLGDVGGQQQYREDCDPCAYNFYIWYLGSTTTTYYYQTRTATTYYDYYRFVQSGEWQDEEITETDTTGFETRTLYRFSSKHTFGEWQVDTPNSCTTDGTEIRYCTDCDAFETRKIPAAHQYALLNSVQPTCTTGGYDIMKCSVCGERSIQNEVGALNHSYIVESTVAPTCTNQGYDIMVCEHAGCTESYYDNYVDALGHHHVLSETIAPTCDEKGYDIYRCDRDGCEDTYCDNYTAASGHHYSFVCTIAATCTKDGYHVYACTKCSAEKREKIAHSGHYFINNTCVDCGISKADAPFDIDGDAIVNASDMAVLRTALLSGETEAMFDVNADGSIDVRDLVSIKKKLANL